MNASCEHFRAYFKDFGPTAFNIIHGIFSACVSQEARRQKVMQTKCVQIISTEFIYVNGVCLKNEKLSRTYAIHTPHSNQCIYFVHQYVVFSLFCLHSFTDSFRRYRAYATHAAVLGHSFIPACIVYFSDVKDST